MTLWSPNPARAALERWWLLYTVVWGALTGVVMVGGFAERWGDLESLLFGVCVAAGAVVPPLVRRPDEDRNGPWWRSTAAKASASVVVFSFGLNYTETPFFFDVLHMHYGFPVTWTIENNPIFLYFVTVAYFSTYFVLCSMAMRAAGHMLRASPLLAKIGAFVIAPFAVAALETALNANPFMARLFCYDDMPFMMWFGTLCYGIAFVCVLPVWNYIDERPELKAPLSHVLLGTLGAIYLDSLALDLLRHHVAPRFTQVETGAMNLGDPEGSCLEPILPARSEP